MSSIGREKITASLHFIPHAGTLSPANNIYMQEGNTVDDNKWCISFKVFIWLIRKGIMTAF